MYKNTFILFVFILIFVLIGYKFKSKNEKFEDIFFGILPSENHTIRVAKLLYYNDPIFIEYGSKFVSLKPGRSVGDIQESLNIINYIKPKNVIKGLTPIGYNEPIFLKAYPNNIFNNNFDKEFKIVPYTRPENNQQPYVEMGDFIYFMTILPPYQASR